MAKDKLLIDDSCLAIGQIIYVLSGEKQTVFPARVVEKTMVETLNGNKISWKLALGSGTKQKIVDSTRISGEIFTNLEAVKKILTERLQEFIEGVIVQARTREQRWYGTINNTESQQQELSTKESVMNNNEQAKIDPASLVDDDIMIEEESINKENLRDKLKQAVMPEEGNNETGASTTGTDTVFNLTTPDGGKIPVNLKA